MADLAALLNSKRVRIWALLALLLIASLVFLFAAMGRKQTAPPAPEAMSFPIYDEAGVPVRHAETFIKRREGDLTRITSRWDRNTATLRLTGEDRGATILVVARGYRIRRLVDVQKGEPIVLKIGLRVRLQVKGSAPPMNPPLVGLFRVRPTEETAKLARLDDNARIPIELPDLMSVLYRNRPDAPQLPVEKFGFAVSEDDAASGIMLPLAGTYEVRWGMLDEGPRVWYTLDDAPQVLIDVPEDGEGKVFDIPIDRSTWARTRAGLQQRIQELKGNR